MRLRPVGYGTGRQGLGGLRGVQSMNGVFKN